MKEAVPTAWIDNAIERIDLGEASRAELKAELKLRYDLNEATASWLLCEGEELKADIIIATRDMVDQITGWLEDVAAMKAEQFLELIDSINSELGSNVAQQYSNLVKPALEQIYTALETSRQELTNGLSVVSGGEMETMGATPASTAGGIPSEAILGMGGGEVEPTPPMQGREKRESVEYSRRLGILLNSKKN
jgi:hypothetical protein